MVVLKQLTSEAEKLAVNGERIIKSLGWSRRK